MTSKTDPILERKNYFFQYVAVITATLLSIFGGISFAWSSPSIPRLLNGELPPPFSDEEASYVALISQAGLLLGCPLIAFLTERLGRKKTMLLSALPQLASCLLISLSGYGRVLLYAGRIMAGIGESANYVVTLIYIGEIASAELRGLMSGYMSVSIRIGIVLINAIGTQLTIKTTSLVCLAFPLLFLVSFTMMPETPHYLLMKGKVKQARKSLEFFRGTKSIDQELDDITKSIERQREDPGTFKDLFCNPSNRKALLIMLGVRSFFLLSGMNAFNMYAQTFFQEAGGLFSSDVDTVIYASVELAATILTALVVDRVGRKPLLMTSCLSCMVVLLAEAILFSFKEYSSIDTSPFYWFPLAGMLIFNFTFALGLGTIPSTLMSEMFSQKVKEKALLVLNYHFAICTAIITKFFQVMINYFGLAIPFYVFSFCCLAGALYCYKYVFETRNRTLEEIQMILKGDK